LGGGAIGISTALVLASFGCTNLLLGETNALRRETVRKTQVCELYDPINDAGPEDNSFDIVLDAVGGRATREASSKAVKPGGTIIHIGLMDSNDGLDIRKFTLQEITFSGCYTYTMKDFRDTVEALHSGKLGDLNWIEQRPLSEGSSAFLDLSQGKTAAAKIILIPDH
jgi:L-iditol 2-dehydrogenase